MPPYQCGKGADIESWRLKLCRAELNDDLQALPFVLATQSKRQLKANLEARLEELTEYQTLLQQEGVLVRL